MFYINCICVAVIFVLISDIFQFWDNFSPIISRLMTKGVVSKPIPSKIMTCSLCQSHWVNVIIMFVMGCVSIPNYLFILGCSFMTLVLPSIIFFIEGFINEILKELNNYFDLN